MSTQELTSMHRLEAALLRSLSDELRRASDDPHADGIRDQLREQEERLARITDELGFRAAE